MQITEICVQVYSTLNVVLEKLKLNGFKHESTITHTDNYYTHIRKNRLKEVDYSELMINSILLRVKRTSKETERLLIYKNKTLNKNNEVIKDEVIETKVIDMEATKRILTLAGMTRWSTLVVEELTFVKNDVKLTIQNTDGLGLFLEIPETPEMQGSSEYKFNELIYIANSLGLDLGKDYSYKKNYMVFKHEFGI